MKILTLNYIEQHLRLDCTCEGEILSLYGEAAEQTIATYLGYTTVEEMTKALDPFPAPLIQAALMLVDVSYQFRSPVSSQNMSIVPYTFDILVKPYVKL